VLPLACTVRNCGTPLNRRGRALLCANGHTFDIARSGYINLLQPHDRKSLDAGDTREAVDARVALAAANVGRLLRESIVARASALIAGDEPTSPTHPTSPPRLPIVVDLGSGTGHLLGTLAGARKIVGIGLDLSTAAATVAARQFPTLHWIVANADRRLPLLDTSVDLILSVHARRNAPECRRVLKRGGVLLIAIPAEDDLIELRTRVLGEAVRRDRVDALVEEHEHAFAVVEQFTIRESADLARPQLIDLLRTTYRGMRRSESERIERLDRLRVTLASEVVVFAGR
jgi:23S rRNA (guanine745-N1)-methyltransferase